MQENQFILISGTSGSGKSVALNALEDLGYYCIDNLPAVLLTEVAIKLQKDNAVTKVAISIDSRNQSFIQDIEKDLERLSEETNAKIIFIDAEDSTLIKRFSETRRKHPLTNKNTSLVEAITLDRKLLSHLDDNADIRIDTSKKTPHQLRALIHDHAKSTQDNSIIVLFQSFGFKYGTPSDTDFIFDVRCLPNPHWDEKLRPFTGLDNSIQTFLGEHPIVNDMEQDIKNFAEKWLPAFIADNRSYLNISIGCTGGKHRSVYITSRLAAYFKKKENIQIQVRHRELNI